MKISYPPDEQYWIQVPEVWLGLHAQRRDQALMSAEKFDSGTISSFAVAMALLEDWHLPGLDGNPEKWDFLKLDMHIIAWVVGTVIPSFNACFEVPKNSSSMSSVG